MPEEVKSLEELLEQRKSSVIEGENGPIMVKMAAAPTSFKATEDGMRSARFTMSTETKDRDWDIVRIKGINTDTFDTNPIALWMHSHKSPPVGTWSGLSKVNGKPKRMEGTLDFIKAGEIPECDQVAKLVELGVYRACSIGFGIDEWDMIRDEDGDWCGGFDILESTLYECSVVAVGANAEALVKAAEIDRAHVVGVIEDILDNWQKTPDGLIVPRAQFEGAYKMVAGEKTVVDGLSNHAINKSAAPEDDDADVDDMEREIRIELDHDMFVVEKKIDRLSEGIQSLLKGIGKITGFTGEAPAEPEYVDGAVERAKALRDRAKQKLAEQEAA